MDDTYYAVDDIEKSQGTSYHRSRFRASEKELFQLFGRWPESNDPEIGWVLGGPGGYVTVYLHNITDVTPARTWVIDWHVGGKSREQTEAFCEWVEAQLNLERAKV